MLGINFTAWRDDQPIPLLEILVVIGKRGLDARWAIEEAEFSGGWGHTGDLHRLSDSSNDVSFLELFPLVADGVQMLEGTVTARIGAEKELLCIVEAIRGDSWDVWGSDSLIDDMKSRYPDATPLPSTAEFDPA